MGHGRMALTVAIGNSLLYGDCNSGVSMGHGEMALVGVIGKVCL